VLSANLMIELDACVATQSWVNREYNGGLTTHHCGAPVLRIKDWGCCFRSSPPGGRPVRESRTQLHRVGLRPRDPKLNDELGGYYGVEG
jgi:hypothetical protein